MNNDYFSRTDRPGEERYAPDTVEPRDMSLQPERHEAPPRERLGSSHAAKLASLSILFSLVVVIGSIAYVVNTRQTSTSTRASEANLYGPASISVEEKQLTTSITEYPKTYKNREIPQELYSEGNQKYLILPEAERKAYVINRVALYYMYEDILSLNNIAHPVAGSPLTFESIEQTMPQLSAIVKSEYPQSDLVISQFIERFGY